MIKSVIESTIADSKNAVAKHTENLADAKCPSFYVQHDSIFRDYANVEIFGLALMQIDNDMPIDELIADTQKQINRKAANPESSTSTNSNMVERYKLASLAKLLQVLNQSIF